MKENKGDNRDCEDDLDDGDHLYGEVDEKINGAYDKRRENKRGNGLNLNASLKNVNMVREEGKKIYDDGIYDNDAKRI